MKNQFILVLISISALFIFESCTKEIDRSPQKPKVPTFTTVPPKDTVVRVPSVVSFGEMKITSGTGGDTLIKVVITPEAAGGFALSHMTDGEIVLKNYYDGQTVRYAVETLVWPIEFWFNQRIISFGTNQTLGVSFQAYVDAPDASSCAVKMQVTYRDVLKKDGVLTTTGPKIRFEKTSFSLEVINIQDELSVVSTSEKTVPLTVLVKNGGIAQIIDTIQVAYDGALGNETIKNVLLLNKQGTQIGSATNVGGKFLFTKVNENALGEKEYSFQVVYKEGIRTGDVFTLRLDKVTTKEVGTNKTHQYVYTDKEGNTILAYKARVKFATKKVVSPAKDGRRLLCSFTAEAIGGDMPLGQLRFDSEILDYAGDSTLQISKLELFADRKIVPRLTFAHLTGDSLKVFSESNTGMYVSILRGDTLPAGKIVTFEVYGTLKGFADGDAVSTKPHISDDFYFGRYLVKKNNELFSRLSEGKGLLEGSYVAPTLVSDMSAKTHSGTPGADSPDWIDGNIFMFVSRNNISATILE